MNKYIIILLIIIILFYLLHPINIEFFEADIYDSPNCCVIRKRRHYDTFKYFFNKSKNCDIYHDNNLRTIREGELIDGKPFKMEDCKNTPLKPVFGSCRKLGRFECTEFVSEKDCKKYPALIWDKTNCYEQTPTELNYYKYRIKNLPKYFVGK